jgi:4-amino-4-deoxy-L-arabinose transferase-like glycosyltransferase
VPPAQLGVGLIIVAWVLFGLVGHDPWKPDEAHYFGVVVDFLRSGDWVVPTLAGEPFVEKPPLLYVVSGAFATLFHGPLALHDAARLAVGLFVGIALFFLGLTARELYGRGRGSLAVLVLIGCLGPIHRMHQLITDVALMAGLAVGMYGLALARRSLVGGALALGTGGVLGFFAKGLLGPGLLAVTALLLPIFASWRSRRYVATLGLAAALAIPPIALWMGALYDRSPQLFHEWLITNNLGRFFGFAHIGPRNPPGFYARELLWFAFPALPLALYAISLAWRRADAPTLRHDIQLPLLMTIVIATVLGLASDAENLYLLPLMLPLALLAARGIGSLPRAGTDALSRAARWGMGALALLLWLGWVVLYTGFPADWQARILAWQPGFVPRVGWVRVTLAASATLAAAWMLWRRAASGSHAVAQWALGVTLCWALASTLWTPFFDSGKSYRAMIHSLARALPAKGCVASWQLGEPQRGLLVYFAQVTTVRLEVAPEAQCDALLVQGWRAPDVLPPSPHWTLVWEGARPGDYKELYRLFRRDVPAGSPVVRFPAPAQ